jgi:hypothetical protein
MEKQLPKIALCLSGEPRDFQYIWQDYSTKINIQKLDPFVHCYTNTGYLSNLPENPERGGASYQALLKVVPTFEYLHHVRPRAALIETYGDTTHHRRFTDSSRWAVERTGSMYYGIQACHNLLRSDLNYDLIIRSRPDIFFETGINWISVYEQMHHNGIDILIPDLYINVGGGIGLGGPYGPWDPSRDFAPDLFWVARAKTLVYFQSIYSDFLFHCGRDVSASSGNQSKSSELYWNYVAEWFLMRWIKERGLKVSKWSLKLMTSRDHIRITQANAR